VTGVQTLKVLFMRDEKEARLRSSCQIKLKMSADTIETF
jgi:hypothetical protein